MAASEAFNVGKSVRLRQPDHLWILWLGTTGRGGAAAVRCHEYDMLHLAFRTYTARPFTHSCEPI